MNKLVIAVFIVSITNSFAENYDWWPKNDLEINKMCRVRHGISEEDMATVMVLRFEDKPGIRPLILCLMEEKNAYRPEVGYELDRIKYALSAAIQYHCEEDIIKECKEKYEELPAEDFFFELYKCIGENQHTDCKTSV